MLVYLAGPITGLTYEGCTEWREQVRDAVPGWIKTASPMRGKQRLKEIAEGSPIIDHYDNNPLSSEKGINGRDYWDVRRCDVVLVNMLGSTKVSIGTVMEIAWARAFSKPVILIMEEGNIHTHCMLTYACAFCVDTLEEGIDALISIASTDQQLEIFNSEDLKHII